MLDDILGQRCRRALGRSTEARSLCLQLPSPLQCVVARHDHSPGWRTETSWQQSWWNLGAAAAWYGAGGPHTSLPTYANGYNRLLVLSGEKLFFFTSTFPRVLVGWSRYSSRATGLRLVTIWLYDAVRCMLSVPLTATEKSQSTQKAEVISPMAYPALLQMSVWLRHFAHGTARLSVNFRTSSTRSRLRNPTRTAWATTSTRSLEPTAAGAVVSWYLAGIWDLRRTLESSWLHENSDGIGTDKRRQRASHEDHD